MTRNNKTVSREEATREKTLKRIFEEPNWLDIPDTVRHRFKSEGWELVDQSEVPEMIQSSVVREEGRYSGAVCRGDLALAKMPTDLAESRQEFYENRSREAVDAVNAQLMRTSDSRMPISNSSRTNVTRGRTASFQD